MFHEAIQPFLQRARRQAMTRAFVIAWVVGSLVAGIVTLTTWWIGRATKLGGVAAFVVVGVGVGYALFRRIPSDVVVVARLDNDFGLKARLISAWELSRRAESSATAAFVVDDAVAHLSTISPTHWIPRLIPRYAFVAPLLFIAAFIPLIAPHSRSESPLRSPAESEAIRNAARAMESLDTPVADEVGAAKSVADAMAALSRAENRLTEDRVNDATRATDTARKSLATIIPATNVLSDGIRNADPSLSNELKAAFAKLRDRLRDNRSASSFVSALEGIETREVSVETLRRIADELSRLEGDADLEAIETIREQKKTLAAVALDAKTPGVTARLDGVAGSESNDSTAVGNRLSASPSESNAATALALETLQSASQRESRVAARRDPSRTTGVVELLPFNEVVVSAQRQATATTRNETLPIAYRSRIDAYFTTLAASATSERGSP